MFSGKKSFFSPYKFLTNLFKKPTTIRYPYEDLDVFDIPGPSPQLRGIHINDMDLCIGCGTCEDICPTQAINMVEGENRGEGKLGQRPEIDYGRCCFCAFCVEMCPTGSLKSSRDYIRTYESPLDKLGDPEVEERKTFFRYLAGDEFAANPGFITPDEQSWLDLNRINMGELKPEERNDSFIEIVKGYSKEQAVKEASRCVECGVCTETCPAHMHIPEYIRGIWDEDLEESVHQIYRTNPLPNVCGRICTHKCETVCAISHRGDAIAIRWLKRYAVDNLPLDKIKEIAKKPVVDSNQKKISIIGSGPAGLSAAYYLGLMGYDITVYEAKEKLGGTMRYGIPDYRLPDDALDADIEIMKDMGVKFKTNEEVTASQFDSIQKKSDAVFVASGFIKGRSTGAKGFGGEGSYLALELLEMVKSGEKFPVGEKILVIGGGNVAYDIARSLSRLQRNKYNKVDVTVICLEQEEEMPADEEEIIESVEEDITTFCGKSPKEAVYENGKLKGVKTVRCDCVFNEEGKFAPVLCETDETFYECDMVVEAIGQAPDYSYIPKSVQDQLSFERGRIKADDSGRTSLDWLFVGGDILHGPDVIHGISDGHASAVAIDEILQK